MDWDWDWRLIALLAVMACLVIWGIIEYFSKFSKAMDRSLQEEKPLSNPPVKK